MENITREILLKELVKRDYQSLNEMAESMTFENLFKAIDGFHLNIQLVDYGDEFRDIDVSFDYNFGCLNGTIYKTEDNYCELGNNIDVWLSDVSNPIAKVNIIEGDIDGMEIVWL